jgi:hypothetical protein
MASNMADLDKLHQLVTKSYTSRIEQDINDNIPTDAATLSGAVKFLKDNAVTADPATKEDLTALRDKLKAQAESNRKRRDTLALVHTDMKAMEA